MKKYLAIDFQIKLFKIIFLVTSLCYTLPIVNMVAIQILKVLVAWGILLITYLFVIGRLRFDNRFFLIFLCFMFISICMNYNEGISRNLKDFLYLLIELVVLAKVSKKTYKQDLILINNIMIFTMCIGYIISLYIFFFQIHSVTWLPKDFIFSFCDGRLWGWCGNPNTLAYMSILGLAAIYINIEFYQKQKNILSIRIFYSMVAILSISCLSLTASRSGMIGFIVLLGFLMLRTFTMNKQNLIKRVMLSILVCIISSIGLQVVSSVLRVIPSMISSPQGLNEKGIAQREIGEDFSNGRFDIWKGGLNVGKDHLLFGVGQDALNVRVNEYLSPEYVKKAPKISTNMHNVYLQVFATSGIFTFLAFILMFAKSLYKHQKAIWNNKHKSTLFGIIVVFLVMNVFDSNIIGFLNLFLCATFWIYFGFLISDDGEGVNVTFYINSLATGGAEKLLIDIVRMWNNAIYNISVTTIFNEGDLLNSLKFDINYSTLLKKPNPLKKALLWRWIKYMPRIVLQYLVKETDDISISFLEGLPTKIVGSVHDRSKQCICWIHTDLKDNSESETNYRNHKQIIQCYQRMKRIVCVSNDCKKKFLSVYPELQNNVEVIYNGVDFELLNKLSDEPVELPFDKNNDDFIFCAVGRLAESKGYERLIRTIAKLKGHNYKIKLLIIGDGVLNQAIKNIIQDLKLDNTVFLLGNKRNPYPYVKLANAFICSSYVEGFSLVVLEALVLHKTVISTKCTGPTELLSDGCGILCDNSEEALFTGIKELLDEKKHSNIDAIDKKIESFNMPNRLIEVYELLGECHV